MTRTSILAVSAFAALSSSCLISTGALAFGHGFGGHAFAPPAVTPHPVVPHQVAPSFSAKRPSFTANHFSKGQTHQTNLANASHLHTSGIHHTTKDTGTTSAQPTSGCGIVCKQPGPVQPVDPTKGGKNPSGGGTTATGTGGSATATGGNSTVNVDTGGSSGGGAGDAIGQIASALSGLGQAQAAASPAQQAAAAAPAQQVVTRVQRVVAEPVEFRAIALGWNNNGAWVVRTSPTLASAGADAVKTCSNQFGACTLSEAQVAPSSFGCLVVVESDDSSRVFAAAGNSSETALAAAAAQITNAGLHGQVAYTGCNS